MKKLLFIISFVLLTISSVAQQYKYDRGHLIVNDEVEKSFDIDVVFAFDLRSRLISQVEGDSMITIYDIIRLEKEEESSIYLVSDIKGVIYFIEVFKDALYFYSTQDRYIILTKE